jgi:SPP1 gp7 family putative phage head morphogenesis protein
MQLQQKRRRQRVTKLPVQQWPSGARLRYSMALRAITRALRTRMLAALGPTLGGLRAAEQAMEDARLRQDANDDVRRMLRRIAAGIARDKKLKRIAADAAKATANHNRGQIAKQLGSVGIELLADEPKLSRYLTAFAKQNSDLIQSLSRDAANQVADLVRDGSAKGTRVEVLERRIAERFDVTESKAELIARDQVGKLNADLTQMRHESVGVTSYRWSTSRDDRVRESHRDLDGTDHEWDDPPVVDDVTGRTAHPGMDYQCRCVAIPNVDALLDELSAA